MEVKGKLKQINETQVFGNNGFRKREVVITTDEQYPQHILVEFVQDKCDLLNSFEAGQEAVIGVNLRGREWVSPQGETKYFNTIQGWKIGRLTGTAGRQDSAADAYEEAQQAANNINEEEDDLPF